MDGSPTVRSGPRGPSPATPPSCSSAAIAPSRTWRRRRSPGRSATASPRSGATTRSAIDAEPSSGRTGEPCSTPPAGRTSSRRGPMGGTASRSCSVPSSRTSRDARARSNPPERGVKSVVLRADGSCAPRLAAARATMTERDATSPGPPSPGEGDGATPVGEAQQELELRYRSAQAELHRTQAKYRALVEQIPAIVYIDVADEDLTTTYVSPQIQQILGYSAQEYIDDPQLWERILHPDDREQAKATSLRGRAAGGSFVFEYRLIARDGRTVWFRDSAIVLPDEHGNPEFIQGVMLDISDRKLAEERIAFLAYHDKLTGLPNRTMFDELLGLALSRARRHDLGVAVVIADLDDFKLVNDSLGHDAGDDLLLRFAQRLGDATRDTDLIARPGGDEFILLLADLERTPPIDGTHDGRDAILAAAESVALRIQEALRRPFTVVGTELYVTASLGISVYPEDAGDAATLLKNAETAM